MKGVTCENGRRNRGFRPAGNKRRRADAGTQGVLGKQLTTLGSSHANCATGEALAEKFTRGGGVPPKRGGK